jgi:hypothetical protein
MIDRLASDVVAARDLRTALSFAAMLLFGALISFHRMSVSEGQPKKGGDIDVPKHYSSGPGVLSTLRVALRLRGGDRRRPPAGD